MANTNCLASMICPDCGSFGPFKLKTRGLNPIGTEMMSHSEIEEAAENGEIDVIEYLAEWLDDGSEGTCGDTEFVEEGKGICLCCGHHFKVMDFRVENQPTKLYDIDLSELNVELGIYTAELSVGEALALANQLAEKVREDGTDADIDDIRNWFTDSNATTNDFDAMTSVIKDI